MSDINNWSWPKMEVVNIECSVENILDSMWLFKHIPWMNHDNKTAHLTLDKVSTVYHYIDGEVKSITFDRVGVSAMHGFAGNSYSFSFLIGDDDVHSYSPEPKYLSLGRDEVIQKAIDHNIYMVNVNEKKRNKLLTVLSNLIKLEDDN
jgi:hypothetical protein